MMRLQLTLIFIFSFFLSVNSQEFIKNTVDSNTGVLRSATISDLNNDGLPDIIVSTPSRTIWYENIDGVNFIESPVYINEDEGSSYTINTADVDNDGDMDILVPVYSSSKVYWYENANSLGTQWIPHLLPGFSNAGAEDVSSADIDGDGDIDLLVNYDLTKRLYWFENTDGLGSFSGGQLITGQTGGRSSRAADIDGDGDLDVYTGTFNSNGIGWCENIDGQGNFSQVIDIPAGYSGLQFLHAQDLDGDGDEDVVAAVPGAGVVLHLNNQDDGSFQPPIVLANAAVANGARSIDTLDADNDGDVDIVFASNNANIFGLLINEGVPGQYSPLQIIDDSLNHARSVATADIDMDGDIDVVGIDQNGGGFIYWYENTTILTVDTAFFSRVTLTPNPTNGIINVQNGDVEIATINVYDIQGTLLFTQVKNLQQINLSRYANGLYFIELTTETRRTIKQVIKK